MIIGLIKRNLKLYFRDRTSVFFSMLGVIIIIMLYLFFLGNMMTESALRSINGIVNDPNSSPQTVQFLEALDVRYFMNSWIMAGVITVATITTTLGAYGVIVTDKSSKVLNDFKVSPIKRSVLVLSYVISAFFVGVIMSCFALVFAEGYIFIAGGEIMSFAALLKTLGVIFLSVLMSSSVIFLIIAFVKTPNAFGAISTVFGSIIGFLMGVYIPMGNLPSGVQTVIKFFPFAHPAVLMRQVMQGDVIDLNLLPKDDPNDLMRFMGTYLSYNGTILPVWGHIFIILGVTFIFFLFGVLVFSRKKESI